ncbi:hypothetical protein BX600DRAFT_531659 [Xylariales sp. PMI_506]|nr:hypothetical protein BX600DRAFT_531659 [Xylariales sp. PMI_506]
MYLPFWAVGPLFWALASAGSSIRSVAAGASSSSSGCGSPAPIPLSTRRNVTLPSGRTFMYFLPATYDPSKPTPLILSYHGASRTSDWQANLDLLTSPFFNTDHILVYPQSLQYGPTSQYLYWEGAPNATADDIGYSADVLDLVESQLCIDRTRIYATGKSQGAGFVGRLACDAAMSLRIAAFAPVSGAFYTGSGASACGDPTTLALSCSAARARIPVLDFHGGNDTTIPITGGPHQGGCLPAIRHWVAEWVLRDKLGLISVANDSLGGSAVRYDFGRGAQYPLADEGLVTFVYDGDHVNHDWPATIPNTDNEAHLSGPATFNASSLIIEYFRKYTLPQNDPANSTTTISGSGSSVVTATTAASVSTVETTATTIATTISSSARTSSSPATSGTGTSSAASSTSTSTATSSASRGNLGLGLKHVGFAMLTYALGGLM